MPKIRQDLPKSLTLKPGPAFHYLVDMGPDMWGKLAPMGQGTLPHTNGTKLVRGK